MVNIDNNKIHQNSIYMSQCANKPKQHHNHHRPNKNRMKHKLCQAHSVEDLVNICFAKHPPFHHLSTVDTAFNLVANRIDNRELIAMMYYHQVNQWLNKHPNDSRYLQSLKLHINNDQRYHSIVKKMAQECLSFVSNNQIIVANNQKMWNNIMRICAKHQVPTVPSVFVLFLFVI